LAVDGADLASGDAGAGGRGGTLEAGSEGGSSGNAGSGNSGTSEPAAEGQASGRPGYTGPAGGWPNLIQGENYSSPKAPTLQETLESGDYKNAGKVIWPREGDTPAHIVETSKYHYVIDSDGNVRVARAVDPLYEHHSHLAQGENTYGAGEMFINPDGTILRINEQSGHYQPPAEEFFPYLKYLLDKTGLTVLDQTFKTTY
jgi:hypothetical protein